MRTINLSKTKVRSFEIVANMPGRIKQPPHKVRLEFEPAPERGADVWSANLVVKPSRKAELPAILLTHLLFEQDLRVNEFRFDRSGTTAIIDLEKHPITPDPNGPWQERYEVDFSSEKPRAGKPAKAKKEAAAPLYEGVPDMGDLCRHICPFAGLSESELRPILETAAKYIQQVADQHGLFRWSGFGRFEMQAFKAIKVTDFGGTKWNILARKKLQFVPYNYDPEQVQG